MHTNLLNIIGNTPLVQCNLLPQSDAAIYAKLEYLNPGGSVKDRSALFMIEQAEKKGILKPGGTIIDASSGNQGIAVALIGAVKGYNVIITVSEKISEEKLTALKAYGAQVIMCPVTPTVTDPTSYHSRALDIHKNTPNSFMPNQYYNTDNTLAHYSLLGPEIWQQTQGKVTHLIAAAGTGGTISGAGKFLKEQNPAIKVLAVDSVNSFRTTNGNPQPYAIEGLGIDFISPVLNASVVDEYLTVTDAEALSMLKPMAQQHGFLLGPSSGAVVWCAQQYAKQLTNNDLMVLIFSDSGRAYLSRGFYHNQDKSYNQSVMHQEHTQKIQVEL